MSANLLLETKQYQVFDLGYGATIINKEPISASMTDKPKNVDLFYNVFFQGDDYLNLLEEIENIEKNKLKPEQINYVIDQYSLIMNDLSSREDLKKIGISVKKKKTI